MSFFLKKSTHDENLRVGSYLLKQSIGYGLFGEVFKATTCNSTDNVAVKRIDKLSSRYNKKRVQNEIKAGKILAHDGVIKIISHFEKLRHFYLVMEFVDGASLIELMEEREFEPLEESIGKDIFGQLISAVSYCHSKGVAHRDIKLDNILVSHSGKVKLIDFGLCELETSNKLCRDPVGSLEYCAPEVLQGKPYSALKADVWSCGVVLFALLFGEFPFSQEDQGEQQRGSIVPLEFCNEDFVQLSLESIDIVRKMLSQCETRPSIEEIKRHSWLRHA